MSGHDIIVIGASTGGVEALMKLAGGLPADLPAAVFVVLHIPPQATSTLPNLLTRAGPLPAAHPVDNEPIRAGRIYIAPPDVHLLVERGRIRVVRGPKENRHRPAVDPLFRSAAQAYGPRVVGVILTGALDDGTAGLLAVKRRGGVAVVQDPDDALFAGMPASALQYVAVDHRPPLSGIAPLLARIAREPAEEEGAYPVPNEMDLETRIARLDPAALEHEGKPGTLSAFSCPECKGPLWELDDGKLLRFRCRTGHAFTAGSALAGQAEAVEEALWIALNTLQESALIAEQLADEARRRDHHRVAAHFDEKVLQTQQHVALLRQVLLNGETGPAAEATGEATVVASG